MKYVAACFTALCLMGFGSSASAQEKDEAPRCTAAGTGAELDKTCVKAGDLLGALDLAVPENALFSLMGSTPETIIRPKAGDAFAASVLPTVVDALGNEQYAIAVEVNPGLAMMPKSFTADSLVNGTNGFDTIRLLSLFTVSAAASKSMGESTVSKYGLGLNFNYDYGSPLLANGAYGDCIRKKYSAIDANQPINLAQLLLAAEAETARLYPEWIEQDGKVKPANKADFEKERAKLYDAKVGKETFNASEACAKSVAPWNRTMYGGGLAVYHSETDALNSTVVPPPVSISETGYGAWGTASWGWDDSQFTISGRWTDNLVRERKDGSQKITETVDGWRIGARVTQNFGDADQSEARKQAYRGFIEAAYTEEDFSGTTDSFTQAGIGFEIQLQKDLYFQGVVGDTFGSSIDRGSYLSGQIKWSFSAVPAT